MRRRAAARLLPSVSAGMVALAVSASCTQIPEPAAGALAPDADADALDDRPQQPACATVLNLHARGAGAYFASGTSPDTGGWGAGGPIPGPNGEWFYIDVFAGGSADDLRGQLVPLGAGANAKLSTATHWLRVLRNCQRQSDICAKESYYPVSGRIIATRIEPRSGTGLELQIGKAVLRRATLRADVLSFDDDESDCIYVSDLWAAGRTVSVDDECAANPKRYLECELALTASGRRVDRP